MADPNTSSYTTSLEKEYLELKVSMYRKFTRNIAYILLATAIIDMLRAIIYSKLHLISNAIVMVIIVTLIFKYLLKLKENQEIVITGFNIMWYFSSMYAHYYGDTGHFNDTIDTFYFAYTCALFERVVTTRMPSAFHRAIFSIGNSIVRLLLISPHDKSLPIIQLMCSALTIYLEFDVEKQDKRLFRTYFNNREQLGKFKDLVENYIPEAIAIVSKGLTQSLFLNNSYKTLFKKNNLQDIRAQLNSFKLRDSLFPANLRSMSLIDLSFTGQTLLNLLENSVYWEQEGANPCHLSFKTNSENSNSERKIFEVKILNITWDDIPAIAIVLHDITQQQMILQLKVEAEIHKDKMLATVSHELRTPLNGILGMIQIIYKKIQDQELLQYLKICRNSANLLLGLVNSILDLNQIRANKLTLYPEKIHLCELLKDIMGLFEFQCAQKKLSLELKVSPRLPRFLVTDKNRLSQIFINLVGNALKFTSKGSIKIVAEESDRHPEFIEFSVVDTGMGIKDEDRTRLFRAFGRLDQDDNQINQQGVGLGLTISNTLADLLCGEKGLAGIRVQSEFGKGSVFSFMIQKALAENGETNALETCMTMPMSFFEEPRSIDVKMKSYQMWSVKKASKTQVSPVISNINSVQVESKSQGTSTILIVDDNPFNITVATHLVSAQGFSVKSALYGQTAIEIALGNNYKREPINLILMDCQMPVMDGYETTRRLRELMKMRKIPEIPIVALTANNSTVDKEACFKAGMSGYLTKPLTEASLKRIVKKYP